MMPIEDALRGDEFTLLSEHRERDEEIARLRVETVRLALALEPIWLARQRETAGPPHLAQQFKIGG